MDAPFRDDRSSAGPGRIPALLGVPRTHTDGGGYSNLSGSRSSSGERTNCSKATAR